MFSRLASCVIICSAAAAMLLGGCASSKQLSSWNDSPSRNAIVSFVEQVTRPGSPDFVPVDQRLAVFDNDGTLWAEQPMYFQLFFAIDRVKVLAPQHPEWKDTEPFASILRGDVKAALAGGDHAILEIIAATHSGMTPEQFRQIVKDWLATARHPTTGRLYTDMVYQPMLDLLAYVRANGFKTYIVSGGGVEFMRAFAEHVYGIPPEQVIGSAGKLKFEMRDGGATLVKLPAVEFIDDKDGKPIAIERIIGRRPVMAFGNSDGDLEMLQWTAAGDHKRFCAFVHHTDAKREWAYDRHSPVGQLNKGLDAAKAHHWTLIDMRNDWKVVFPPQTR